MKRHHPAACTGCLQADVGWPGRRGSKVGGPAVGESAALHQSGVNRRRRGPLIELHQR